MFRLGGGWMAWRETRQLTTSGSFARVQDTIQYIDFFSFRTLFFLYFFFTTSLVFLDFVFKWSVELLLRATVSRLIANYI